LESNADILELFFRSSVWHRSIGSRINRSLGKDYLTVFLIYC